MARYIDADALLEELNFIEPDEELYENDHAVWLDCRMDVIHAPTADVVEVKHGEWIHTDYAEHWRGKDECSLCGYHFEPRLDLSCFNYCPGCGAKMDGKE